jgi:type IV pilus assembly protein PilB
MAGREIFYYRAKGCSMCNHSGYSGRIAIHEVIPVKEEIRELMARVAPISEVQHCAKKSGFQSMRYDGLEKKSCAG